MNKQEFDTVRGLKDFFERFYPNVKEMKNDKSYEFKGQDKDIWKIYYEKLILPGILDDGKAFGAENSSNLGIGNDGIFLPVEYYQLLMQCYKYMYEALSCGEIYLNHTGWQIEEQA